MTQGFWGKLKKPIVGLAPMYDVTDAAFRRIVAKYGGFTRHSVRVGGPDVIFTEFVSCDGLCSDAGKKKLLEHLIYTERERPIVAQVFGANPKTFAPAIHIIHELGFDGVDINMGCPDKAVVKQGAGAALIGNPKLAQELVREAKLGAGTMPVSIKTRIGYNKNEITKWLPYLLEAEPAAITIHGRTKKEMSKAYAHWNIIAEAVEIVRKYNSSKTRTLILGNGDVTGYADALEKVCATGVDGVLIGRAAIGNPWVFDKNRKEIPLSKKLAVMVEHAKLFEKLFGTKSFNHMRKHCKAYLKNVPHAGELRVALMGARCAGDVAEIAKRHI